MAPAPRTPAPSSGFRHDAASCHDSADAVVPPRSITMEGVTRTTAVSPSRDANNKAVSSAGSITEYTSRRQPERPAGDRVEASLLLPLKKRAVREGSSSHSGNSDDNNSSLLPPNKRRMYYVDTGSEGAAASTCGMTPFRSHHEPSSSNAITTVTPEPPREKLMHDAIRSSARSDRHHLYVPRPRRQRPGSRLLIMEEGETSAQGAAAAAAAAKKTTTATAKKKGKAPARVDAPMATARVTMALNYRLDSLGATRPRRLYVKRLHRSDVDRNQNRLLISCKREVLHNCPITRFFTKEETRHVQDQAKNGGLAPVYAFDRLGRTFKIRLRYLDSNGGYRFIGEWGDFLSENGFYLNANSKWTRQVDVELWAFRSWELPNGEESGHPDGALGLLLLPYEDRVDVVGRGEEQRMPALPAHETETGHAGQAPATAPVQEEEALADARAEQGEAVVRDMTLDEMVQAVGEEMADPVIGLLMLARLEGIEDEKLGQ